MLLQVFKILLLVNLFSVMTHCTIQKPQVDQIFENFDKKFSNDEIEELTAKFDENFGESWREEILQKITTFNNEENICIQIRLMMKVLPSYDPIKNNFTSLFRRFEKYNLKSNRAIAYGMVYEVIQLFGDDNSIYLTETIEFLKRMKRTYNEQFMINWKINTDFEMAELTELKKKKIAEEKKFNKVNETLMKALEDQQASEELLETLSTSLKNSQINTPSLLKELKILNLRKFEIENVTTVEDIVALDSDYYFNLNNDLIMVKGELTSLILNYEIAQRLQDNIQELIYEFTSQNMKSEVSKLQTTLKDNKDNCLVFEKERERLIGIFTKELDKHINKKFTILKSVKEFSQYQFTINKVIAKKRELQMIKNNHSELKTTLEDINFKLGEINIKKNLDFVISPNTIPRSKLKVHNMEKTISILEILNTNIKVTTKASVDKSLKKFDPLTRLNQRINVSLIPYINKLNEKIAFLKDKINLEEKIYLAETLIDKFLGNLFGLIYKLPNNLRCFTDSQLSYYFFNMLKTNIIVNEFDFLEHFLVILKPEQAKSFIIFNYSLFNNQSYVDKIISRYESNVVQSISDSSCYEMISQFIINFTSMVNLYKDHTLYGTTQGLVIGPNGNLFSRLYFVIKKLIKVPADLTKQTVIAHTMGLLGSILIGLLPFLGSIPMINAFFVKLFTRIFNYLITLLISIFKFTSQQLLPYIKSIKNSISVYFNKTIHFTLDYKDIIQNNKEVNFINNLESDQALNIDIEELENVYYGIFKNESSILNMSQKTNLFKSLNYLFDPNDIENIDNRLVILKHEELNREERLTNQQSSSSQFNLQILRTESFWQEYNKDKTDLILQNRVLNFI